LPTKWSIPRPLWHVLGALKQANALDPGKPRDIFSRRLQVAADRHPMAESRAGMMITAAAMLVWDGLLAVRGED